jgi:DNA-binding transcriptional ArsR family regulator
MEILNKEAITHTVKVLRALNNPLRQKMIELIVKNPDVTVTEIYTRLKIEQSVASLHLSILRQAGFVISIRNGHSQRYRVNKKSLNEIQKEIQRIVKISEIIK